MTTTVRFAVRLPGVASKRVPIRVLATQIGGKKVVRTVGATRASADLYKGSVKLRTRTPVSVVVQARKSGRWVKIASGRRAFPVTKVTGWDSKVSKTIRRGNIADTVKITPAFGRPVYLQMKSGGKWVNVTKYKTANKKSASVKVTLPKAKWEANATTQWRVNVPKVKNYGLAKATGTKTVTRTAPASKITGWDTGKVVYTDTAPAFTWDVVVSPAYGRTAYLMSSTNGGSTWNEVTHVVTANRASASVKFSAPSRTAPSNVMYRVEVRNHKEGKAAKTGTLNIVAEKRVTSTPSPSPTSTPKPSPTPSPSPTQPGSLTGTECNNLDYLGNPFPCNAPAYGLVQDVAIAGNLMGCGTTRFCGRPYNEAEREVFQMDGVAFWDGPSNLVRKADVQAVPNLISEINKRRAQAGRAALVSMPVSVTVQGTRVLGQGGYAQTHADYLMGRFVSGESSVPLTHANKTAMDSWWTQNVTPPAGKSKWMCDDPISPGTVESGSLNVVTTFETSVGHWAALMSQSATHIAVGASMSNTGNGVYVVMVCSAM